MPHIKRYFWLTFVTVALVSGAAIAQPLLNKHGVRLDGNASKSVRAYEVASSVSSESIQLTVPNKPAKGSSVPIKVVLSEPLLAGQYLEIGVAGKPAVTVYPDEEFGLSEVWTRVRLTKPDNVTVRILTDDGELANTQKFVQLKKNGTIPTGPDTEPKRIQKKIEGKDRVLILVIHPMYSDSFLKALSVTTNMGGVKARFTNLSAANPYLKLKSRGTITTVSVSIP